MQRKRETRPADQSNERVHKSMAMVADPFAKCTWHHKAALLAAFTLTFAIITWCEAGPLPAIAGIVTSIAAIAVIETISKGVLAR